MAGDYIPHSEPKLVEWAKRFVAFAAEHAEELSMTEEELQQFLAQHEEFSDSYTEFRSLQIAVGVACRRKDTARKAFVKHMRSVAMRMQVVPGIPSAQKHALGLSTGEPKHHERPDVTRSKPTLQIKFDQLQKHVVEIRNSTSSRSRHTKPRGAYGCEVYRRIGGPQNGLEGMQLVSCAFKNELVVNYPHTDVGQRVYYAARWVDRKGKKGPWSDIKVAIVA